MNAREILEDTIECLKFRKQGNREQYPDNTDPESGAGNLSSLNIGAQTVAGVGLGLVGVIAGAAVLGIVAEAVIIPTLMAKLAGGVAGGGLGLAKAVHEDNRRR